MKFPKIVYVQVVKPTDLDEYLIADPTEEAAMNTDLDCGIPGQRVGVYQLVEVVRITEKRTYTKKKVKN